MIDRHQRMTFPRLSALGTSFGPICRHFCLEMSNSITGNMHIVPVENPGLPSAATQDLHTTPRRSTRKPHRVLRLRPSTCVYTHQRLAAATAVTSH
ncbi:hypothetical protein C8Q79DRAFT_975908 [Trametes meyenii]|nr:hypothetical protein C8Q79DRAFT_975908 [Trametes meyenii]